MLFMPLVIHGYGFTKEKIISIRIQIIHFLVRNQVLQLIRTVFITV